MPQMSYLKVCQYVKTEVLTRVKLGVCLSSLPSENHDVSEGKWGCREDQVSTGSILCWLYFLLFEDKGKFYKNEENN